MAMPETRATFVVRLWHEGGAPPGEWRGEIEHVQSQRVVRFTERAALFEFIHTQLAEMERIEPKGGGSRRSG